MRPFPGFARFPLVYGRRRGCCFIAGPLVSAWLPGLTSLEASVEPLGEAEDRLLLEHRALVPGALLDLEAGEILLPRAGLPDDLRGAR